MKGSGDSSGALGASPVVSYVGYRAPRRRDFHLSTYLPSFARWRSSEVLSHISRIAVTDDAEPSVSSFRSRIRSAPEGIRRAKWNLSMNLETKRARTNGSRESPMKVHRTLIPTDGASPSIPIESPFICRRCSEPTFMRKKIQSFHDSC